MLIHQGDHRTSGADRRLASLLAAVAGGLNATAFYAAGFFSANMTGNVSLLSDRLALGRWGDAAVYASIVAAFIAGAVLSTVIISAGQRRGLVHIYALCVALEAVLLLPLGAVALWMTGTGRIPLIVLGLAFAMGIQNAIVTRLSNARVRTTHVSGMATDIGIELGLLLAPSAGTEDERRAVIERLRLHVETILAFLAGGVAGIATYRFIGGYVFWVAAAVLAVTAGHALLTVGSGTDRRAHDL